jgi:ribulose-phosphate 3-epimerase
MAIKVAPSILSADFARLGEEVRDIQGLGADWLHIDVMDGHFVPNITIGPDVVAGIRKQSKLIFDVHLMIEHPELFIDAFRKAGSDIISVHAEACKDLGLIVDKIRATGAIAGVSINPGTDISAVFGVLDKIGAVTIMSVNPGFAGQKFMPESIDRIKALRKEIGKRKVLIEVDGGVNAENAPLLRKAGADVLAAGSFIFKSPDRAKAIKSLKGE